MHDADDDAATVAEARFWELARPLLDQAARLRRP